MANPYDPFNLSQRKDARDPKTGPGVPNMGGFPVTPLSPAANLNPFAIPPVPTPDQGGRPTMGAVGPSPLASPLTPTAAASPVSPPIREGISQEGIRDRMNNQAGPQAAAPAEGAPREDVSQEGIRDRQNNQSGVTINIGEKGGSYREDPRGKAAEGGGGSASPAASGGMGTPAAGPVAGLPPPIKLDRLPTAAEMNFAPAGAAIETHLGTMTRSPDGTWQMQPNEAGIMKYKAAKVRAIQQFGQHPLSSDPNAPLPPVEPGKPWFNPFTGQWGGE